MKIHRVLRVVLTALALLALAAPVVAESRLEKDLELQSGGRFTLNTDVGGVSVSGTARSGAHIVITSGQVDLNNEFDFTFTTGPGWVTVTARCKHSSFWSRSTSVRFEIEVPVETSTAIHTGGGGISLSGLRGAAEVTTSGVNIEVVGLNGKLGASTSGGPIRLREVTGDAVVNTSGGPIGVESVDGNLTAHTSGGGIRIRRVSGYVDAKTSGGSIQVTYDAGNRQGGDIETSGGSIDLAVDASANLSVDASTSGGSVTSDLPMRTTGALSPSHVQGSLGAGGEHLRLHTSGGSIHIHAL